MSAKVLKKAAAAGAIPLSVSLASSSEAVVSTGPQKLIVPELEPIEFVEPPAAHFEVEEFESTEDLLDHAQREAERIIAAAEQNAAVIEQAANERAVTRAKAELEAEHAQIYGDFRSGLAETIARVGSLDAEINGGLENEAVELALQIARKIVAREVTIDREIALTLAKVSLAKLHNRVVAEIHLHPQDYAYIREHLDKLDYRGKIELIEDKSITLGGCLIHTETGDIDARIESQFDEISRGLMG